MKPRVIVRVLGITRDRRTHAQRMEDQLRAIRLHDMRIERDFRERVRQNVARRIERRMRADVIPMPFLLQRQAD